MQNEIRRPNARAVVTEILTIIFGSVIYGLAVAFFLGPSGTVMGGATGIATTINILFPNLSIGMMLLVVNIPILLLGLFFYGWHLLWRVIVAVLVTSFATNIAELLPFSMITDDRLLAAIMGGLLLGSGSGMLLARGYNTGGSDLAAVMIKQKLIKSVSTGRIMFVIDLFIITGSAILTRNFSAIFYSIVSTYTYTFALDYIIDGNKSAKMTFIISDKYKEIAAAISTELDRGVTILHGLGWYSQHDKDVILCVFKPQELYRAKVIVKSMDPNAFMILTDAKEVMGEGFGAPDL